MLQRDEGDKMNQYPCTLNDFMESAQFAELSVDQKSAVTNFDDLETLKHVAENETSDDDMVAISYAIEKFLLEPE